MKKNIFIAVIMLLLVLPVLLCAEATSENSTNIWIVLAPLIATIVTPLGIRLFNWLGIPLEEHVLSPILVKLIEIIAGVEKSHSSYSGADRKKYAVSFANEKLSNREKKLLHRRFGSLETAVQAAFEMSSVAQKRGK